MPSSHAEYGQTVVREAVDKGYVERAPTKKAEYKGRSRGHVTMNHITPPDKQHLKGLPDN